MENTNENINTKSTENSKPVEMDISLSRHNGETYLEYALDSRFENIFKELEHEVRESKSWEGTKFYYVPSIINNPEYQELLRKYSLFDDFGHALFRNADVPSRNLRDASQMFLNVAFLRTLGGKGKVRVSNVPFASATTSLKNLVAFVKEYYRNFHENFRVGGHITIQI